MKVAVVYSGGDNLSSLDDADTLKQLEEVTHNIKELGHEVTAFPFHEKIGETEKDLLDYEPDCLFNLVEAAKRTDRLCYTAAAFFDFIKIPYTGCPAVSLAMTANKILQKKTMIMAGIPTPSFTEGTEGPYIVKPVYENASVGIGSENVVQTCSEAQTLIKYKKEKTGIKDWFIEHYIDGREFNIAVLSREDGTIEVLPLAEMTFVGFPEDTPKIVDYAAKWKEESFTYNATIRNFDFDKKDEALLAKLKEITLRCCELFQLRGVARVDFRVDKKDNPWVLEVNPNPCLSSDAGFMSAAAQAGLSGNQVVKRLLAVLN